MMQQRTTLIDLAYLNFMLDARTRRLTVRTIGFYEDRLAKFLAWCTDQRQVECVESITATHIREYLLILQERKLSDYSQHAAARAIKTFLNFCVREEYIVESPMRKVRMPRIDRKILPAFEMRDVKEILAACDTERDRAIINFLLDTGVRVSEFVALKGQDIDISDGTVHVRLGKGRKGRHVHFSPKTAQQLLRYFMRERGGLPGPEESVWFSLRGRKPLTTYGVQQLTQRLGKRALVEGCSPHAFRRTFALWHVPLKVN